MHEELGNLLITLRDEMFHVLKNHFRAQLYDRLVIKHCSNIFKYRDYRNANAQNPHGNEVSIQTGHMDQGRENVATPRRPIILSKSKPNFPPPLRTSTPIPEQMQLLTPQKTGKLPTIK